MSTTQSPSNTTAVPRAQRGLRLRCLSTVAVMMVNGIQHCGNTSCTLVVHVATHEVCPISLADTTVGDADSVGNLGERVVTKEMEAVQ